jgi:predicted O-linked N-acetylglucosamine transferase (SPINDLY family)
MTRASRGAQSTFVSRVAASLAINVGLPELIAAGDEDCLALLPRLACNPGQLRKVRTPRA